MDVTLKQVILLKDVRIPNISLDILKRIIASQAITAVLLQVYQPPNFGLVASRNHAAVNEIRVAQPHCLETMLFPF